MPYFHVVFTVPDLVATIAFQNQAVVYDFLFGAAAETLRVIAADPAHLGAEIGFLGVLHLWGSNSFNHRHIHFLVPGGGIAPDGQRWIACRPGFFLPVKVLSRMFRASFLRYLEKAFCCWRTELLPRTFLTRTEARQIAAKVLAELDQRVVLLQRALAARARGGRQEQWVERVVILREWWRSEPELM